MTTRKGKNSTTAQGRIVERIVALMHDKPGIIVERNKQLPPIHGKGRAREIDVLITGDLAGYPIQIAIECKDEAEAIGSPKIDAFVGKLHYLGISPRQSIYVSTHGYTSGARERAAADGVKLFTLRHLTDEDLSHSITGAFQSTVYLLLQVVHMSISNGVPPPYQGEAVSFFNADGKLAAVLPDLIWRKWMSDEIPLTLGEHELDIPIPADLQQMVKGAQSQTSSIEAKISVIGAIATLEGQMQGYQLIHDLDETPERVLYDISFSTPKTSLPVTTVLSEDQLYTILNKPGSFQAVFERIKLPRIVCGPYWPPSERVFRLLQERWRSFQAGEISEFPSLDWREVEGTDLSTIWEPIWKGHPAGRQRQEENHS